MLDQIAPSYLYEQYADDPDLQAFVTAYNLGQKTIQQWFFANLLPFWPGLSGDLLEWAGEGIYGLPKTSIASLPTQALGPLNTEVMNSQPLNSFIPSTQQVFALTDDLYQRILTWHLYRGDGRHFTVRWFKRRIMRFLVGTAGLDPQPELPGFPVGCETTQAISVGFNNGICTVTISQTLLSLLAPLAPNVLTVFAAALQNGSLELPLQYTYQVQIISPFAAVVLPSSIFASEFSATVQSAPVSVEAIGNTGPLTYQWSWISVQGEAVSANPPGIITDSNGNVVWDSNVGISIDEPTGMSTTFTANNMVPGETRMGVASCVVTDTGTAATITVTCAVTISHP